MTLNQSEAERIQATEGGVSILGPGVREPAYVLVTAQATKSSRRVALDSVTSLARPSALEGRPHLAGGRRHYRR
jgi:hypothetical protein